MKELSLCCTMLLFHPLASMDMEGARAQSFKVWKPTKMCPSQTDQYITLRPNPFLLMTIKIDMDRILLAIYQSILKARILLLLYRQSVMTFIASFCPACSSFFFVVSRGVVIWEKPCVNRIAIGLLNTHNSHRMKLDYSLGAGSKRRFEFF